MKLRPVPLTPGTVGLVSGELAFFGQALDLALILMKNEQYGDSWQAEGPFVAAGRMKDKIVRVETLIVRAQDAERVTRVVQTTEAEGFQDILEIVQYAKMLMLYWVYNGLGITGDEPKCVRDLYRSIGGELMNMQLHEPDASRERVARGQEEDSPST